MASSVQTKRPMVKYTIRNELGDETFNLTQDVPLVEGEVFQRIMEKAATNDHHFRFTAAYYDETLGYAIVTINGLKAENSGTWWRFLRAPNHVLPLGVSNYKPSAGEHLIMEFTAGGQCVD